VEGTEFVLAGRGGWDNQEQTSLSLVDGRVTLTNAAGRSGVDQRPSRAVAQPPGTAPRRGPSGHPSPTTSCNGCSINPAVSRPARNLPWIPPPERRRLWPTPLSGPIVPGGGGGGDLLGALGSGFFPAGGSAHFLPPSGSTTAALLLAVRTGSREKPSSVTGRSSVPEARTDRSGRLRPLDSMPSDLLICPRLRAREILRSEQRRVRAADGRDWPPPIMNNSRASG